MTLIISSNLLLLLLATVLVLQAHLSCQIDLTMKEFAKGHDVVAKVVSKLDASGIFSQQDNGGFLHRIAYQMTHDGDDPDTYRNGYYGGIWQVDEENFLATQNQTLFGQFHKTIWDKFGMNWTATTRWKDLRIPFYSGIAASLYIETFIPLSGQIPAKLEDQATYWYENYKTKGEKGTVELFIENSKRHEKEYKCVAKRDICFILDSSGSVGVDNHNKALQFLWQVVDSMVIAENDTHISMLAYSTNPRLAFVDLYNKTTIKTEILNVPYIGHQSGTYTGRALNVAMDRVYLPYFRKNISAILPVFMVLTDGKAHDNVLPGAHRMAYKGITAIAVGIGPDAVDSQLLEIANNVNEHVFHSSSFEYLDAIFKLFEESTCSSPAEFRIDDEPIEFDMGPVESTYLRVGLPREGATVTVDVKMGQVSGYASYTEQTPNSAVYDEIIYPDGQPKYFAYSKYGAPQANNNATLYVGFKTGEKSSRNVFRLGIVTGHASRNLAPTNLLMVLIIITIIASLLFHSGI